MTEYNALVEARNRDAENFLNGSVAENLGRIALILRETGLGWAINEQEKSGIELICESIEKAGDNIAEALHYIGECLVLSQESRP